MSAQSLSGTRINSSVVGQWIGVRKVTVAPLISLPFGANLVNLRFQCFDGGLQPLGTRKTRAGNHLTPAILSQNHVSFKSIGPAVLRQLHGARLIGLREHEIRQPLAPGILFWLQRAPVRR